MRKYGSFIVVVLVVGQTLVFRWPYLVFYVFFSGHYFGRTYSGTFFQLFFNFFNFFLLFSTFWGHFLGHSKTFFQHIPHCSCSLCLKFYCIYLQCRVGAFSLTCLATKVCTLVTFNNYWVSEFL